VTNSLDALDADVGRAFFGAFVDLRPMQKVAVNSLCAGRNVILSAGTGSGKTEAVVAPLTSRYRKDAIRDESTFLVYVSPTKALVNDLHRRLAGPLDRLGLRLSIRHGDRNDLLNQPPHHVILTTPESLGILITDRHPCLKTLRAVVLDEVHLLYNTQRGQMTAILLHRLNKMLPAPIQFAAISATVGDLEMLRYFLVADRQAADLLPFPGAREIVADIRTVGSTGELATLLERLMRDPRRKLLIFAQSRREVEELAGAIKAIPALEKLVVTHHSSLAPEVRQDAERWFGSEAKAICVSTSTLELGIDIGDIDAVVLYGPTYSMESLLQRIGRGNRLLNKTNAICIARYSEDSIREPAVFSAMMQLASQGVMPNRGPLVLFGAALQQCLCTILQNGGAHTRISDIAEQVGYQDAIDRTATEAMLEELSAQNVVQHHGFKNRYGASEGLWELREKNLIWGNFSIAGQTIDVTINNRTLGSIPRSNLMRLSRGVAFLLGGHRYRVRDVIAGAVRVESAEGQGPNVPLIYGKDGAAGIEAFVASALWDWLFSVTPENSFMEPAQWGRVEPYLIRMRSCVNRSSLPVVRGNDSLTYFTFAGTTVNRVVLAAFGHDPKEAGDIYLRVPKPIDLRRLPTSTAELAGAAEASFASSGRQTIFQQYLPQDMQRAEWRDSWLKDQDAASTLLRLQASCEQEVDVVVFKPFLASP